MKDPRVLVLDCETAPMIAYVWGRRDQNIATNQIKNDWHLMSYACKWLGTPAYATFYSDQRNEKHIENDKALLEELWVMLDSADILITQNGKNFDSRKINARFIEHGMTPPSPYKHLDTYQIVRRVADFSSNSLEFLTSKLCTKYKKLTHAKYPGMTLWKECLAGNMKAWDEMKKYNIHDVLATEELYMKLRAWAPANAPKPYQVSDVTKQCGVCGTTGLLNARGHGCNKKGIYQKYQCQKCGSWQSGPVQEAA